VRWLWDPDKAAANRSKHGLSFETAVLVFDDPLHASKLDPHLDGDRWRTIGLVGPVLLLVIHTWPEGASEADEAVGRISARGRLPQAKGKYMKRGASKLSKAEQLAELTALAAVPDEAIDTSDAPEVLDWSGAKRGLFYRPLKQRLTLRVDADVIAWFKARATSKEGYQTRINRALREYVQGQGRKRGQSKRA
jgi:uncharacterized protein